MAKRGTPAREYDLLEQVGTGSFGTVHRAVNKSTHEIVAIKVMKKSSKGDCTNAREYRTLKHLARHPNIVKLYDSYAGPAKELYFVMEYMDRGNLYQLIKQRREAEQPLKHAEVRSILRQTLTALAHLHQQGIFHRDMKPENILIGKRNNAAAPRLTSHDHYQNHYKSTSNNDHEDNDDEEDDDLIIKLADFGLARQIKSKPPYTEYVSTRWYRAPEVLLHSTNYSYPVDLWAVGAIFAELVMLKPIFPGRSEIDQLFRICQILGNPLGTVMKRRLAPLLSKKASSSSSSSSSPAAAAAAKAKALDPHHQPLPHSHPPLKHDTMQQQRHKQQQQHQQQLYHKHEHKKHQQHQPPASPPDPTRDWSDGIRLANKIGFDFPQLPPKPLSTVLPTATQPMLDLLAQFLTFDPACRINAADALASPFLRCRRHDSTTSSTTLPSPSIMDHTNNNNSDNSNNNKQNTPPLNNAQQSQQQQQRKSLLWAKGVAMKPPPTPSQQQQQQSSIPIGGNNFKMAGGAGSMAQDIRDVLRLSKSKTIDRLQRKKPSLTSIRIAAANIGRSTSSYDFSINQQQQQRRRSSQELSTSTSTFSIRRKKPPSSVVVEENVIDIRNSSNNSSRNTTSSSSSTGSGSIRKKQGVAAFDLPSIPALSPIQMCSDWGTTTRAASLVQQRMV
ncbi:kinase-like domain-containing protein [Zychaea mexicana]|uniref:kinase-like domain-containing protein n=1 Tax=Zychaea mexicana TaxID=64656 RepID=UPI0022FE6369|nr:kinase-like domain-containing protein [Zychaea mexicana]KAI9494145.1 kinase-like domain-containing protein [Zychaea mexicana]